MSLNRLALRWAAIAALSNNGAAPWPTAAEARVFDSRLDPVDKMVEQDGPYPLVAVYTEGAKNGVRAQTLPGDHVCELVVQLAIALKETSGDDPGVYAIGFPASDSELESSLDLLEAQAIAALAASEAFQSVSQGILEAESFRGQTKDGQALAVRYTVLGVKLLRDAPGLGRVPKHFEPLLALLDRSPAYASRAALFRTICAAPGQGSEGLVAAVRQQWSRDAAEGLGHHVAPAPVRFPTGLRPAVDHPDGWS